MGNSRGPLREAIRRLTAEGFLRQAPTGGSIVVEFSRSDVAELYELREALEVYAVGKAAEHKLRDSELETLKRAVNDVLLLRDELEASGESHLGADEMRRFIRIDLQFHTMLVRAAANSRILKVVADTRVLLNVFAHPPQGPRRRATDPDSRLPQPRSWPRSFASDPQEAMRLLGEHIRVSKEERLKEYDDREREAALGHPLLGLSQRRRF